MIHNILPTIRYQGFGVRQNLFGEGSDCPTLDTNSCFATSCEKYCIFCSIRRGCEHGLPGLDKTGDQLEPDGSALQQIHRNSPLLVTLTLNAPRFSMASLTRSATSPHLTLCHCLSSSRYHHTLVTVTNSHALLEMAVEYSHTLSSLEA